MGRQRSDFDGDGYADVILTAWGGGHRGRVLVGFGPSPSDRVVVLEANVPPETADRFGEIAEPLGDVDADGFADLLVTAAGDPNALTGGAEVFYGQAAFGSTLGRGLRLDGEEGERLGGVAIPAGDVDGDGMQDFVLGGAAAPKLYRGLSRGVSPTEIDVLRSEEWLSGMSSGDVTGDGYSDLLANSVAAGFEGGRYDLISGSSAGLGEPTVLGETDDYPLAPWTITGDVNGDGFSDVGLTVNHPGDPNLSRTDVSLGAEMPPFDSLLTWAAGVAEDAQYLDLGGSIAAGDVNGDGFDDALVPHAWHGSDLVEAHLYLGGLGSRSAADAVYAFRTGTLLFISTGLPSGPGDVNGDGFDDVFLVEDGLHTAKLYFGGPELDAVADDELELAFP